MHISLLISDFADGGVERTLANLAAGLAGLRERVDFLTGSPSHPYLADLTPAVRIIPLPPEPEAELRAYLGDQRPDILLTGKLRDDLRALKVRDRLRVDTRLVTTVGTHLSSRLSAQGFNPVTRIRDYRRIRHAYVRFDGITAVSQSVARDLRRRFGVDPVRLRVLLNPVVPEDVEALASGPCPHPWLAGDAVPVLLAVGGLRKVKDFPTLLRAFARLSHRAELRLLILGEGKERAHLGALANKLGVAERLDMPGFVAEPFPYLARARVLVLTSRREGLGNVLVEAMAVGTPVVATDCPGGVHELLQGGRLGRLVPVGDPVALSAALDASLAIPPDTDALRQAARPYRIREAAATYLGFFRDLLASRPRSRAQ